MLAGTVLSCRIPTESEVNISFHFRRQTEHPSQAPAAVNRRAAAATDLAFTYATVVLALVKGVILVPLYLRHFSLATYGSWLAATNVLSAFGFFETGVNFVYRQRLSYAHGRKDDEEFKKIAGSGIPLFLSLAVGFLAMGLILSPFVAGWTKAGTDGPSVRLAFVLAAGGTALTLVQNTFCAISLAWQRTFAIGVTRLGAYLVEVVVIVLGLWFGLGVVTLGLGVLTGAFFGATTTGLYVLAKWRSLRLPRPRIDRQETLRLGRETLPVFLAKAGNQLTRNSEELLTTLVASPSAAAVLALTRRGIELAQLIANPLAGSVFSGLAHAAGERGAHRTSSTLREIFAASAILSAIVIPIATVLNRDFVSLWVGPNSYGGTALTVGLAVSTVLVVRTNLLASIVAALGEIRRQAYSGLGEAVVRVVVVLVAMPSLGLLAVPLSSILGVLCVSGWYLTWVLARILRANATAIEIQLPGVVALVASGACGAALAVSGPAAASWLALAVKAVTTAALMTGVVLVASPEARKWIRNATAWMLSRRAS